MMRKTKDDPLKSFYYHSDVFVCIKLTTSVYLMEINFNIESTVKKHLSIIIVMSRSPTIPLEMSTGLIFANFEHL